MAIFDSFLGSKGFKNNVEPIFFIQGFTKTNFSSKFQFLEKMMAAPPRTKLVQRICWCGHVQYVSKVLKIGFVFFGNNFRVIYLFLGTVDRNSIWIVGKCFKIFIFTIKTPWNVQENLKITFCWYYSWVLHAEKVVLV